MKIKIGRKHAPPTPVWPMQWNSTWAFLYTENGTFIDSSYWFYDDANNLLRQDNHEHCNDIEPGVLCSAIFKNNNIYWYIPSKDICCLCWTDVPITAPSWLNISTYGGNAIYNWLQVPSSLWNFTAVGEHAFYQSLSSFLPIAESGWGTDLYWVDIVQGPQNPDVFYTPSTCTQQCNPDLFNCGTTSSSSSTDLQGNLFDVLRSIRL